MYLHRLGIKHISLSFNGSCCVIDIIVLRGVLPLSLTVQMHWPINPLSRFFRAAYARNFISISATTAIIYIYDGIVKFYAVSEAFFALL